jgi:hypothetical protein
VVCAWRHSQALLLRGRQRAQDRAQPPAATRIASPDPPRASTSRARTTSPTFVAPTQNTTAVELGRSVTTSGRPDIAITSPSDPSRGEATTPEFTKPSPPH